MKRVLVTAAWFLGLLALGRAPQAAVFDFSTGSVTGSMGTASRPAAPGKIEIETGDDFLLATPTRIQSATFTGLLTGGVTGADVNQVRVEIYRVFPVDSTVPPSGDVPSRANSPADIAYAERDSSVPGQLSFSTVLLTPDFTVSNSVINGINKSPNQTTGGEGAQTGALDVFNVGLASPLVLPAGHYFFVPQVGLSNANGEFLWLSASKPIDATGTPFLPDLQSWIRNESLAPDWLRVGTDIEGLGRTYNAAFTLHGETVPEPSSLALWLLGLVVAGVGRPLRRNKHALGM